jgi:hypothetical protein
VTLLPEPVAHDAKRLRRHSEETVYSLDHAVCLKMTFRSSICSISLALSSNTLIFREEKIVQYLNLLSTGAK